MTKAKILIKAWEAGLICKKDNKWVFERYSKPSESILIFAKELILAEREACAKVCESFKQGNSATYIDDDWADMCATAVRARGEATLREQE